MLRLLGHYTKQKRQKRKDVRAARAVESSVSDAAGAMDSSEQTVLSSAVSWMSTAMATKWHGPADCSTCEPQPPETHGLWLLTGMSQARRVCSLMPSEDYKNEKNDLRLLGDFVPPGPLLGLCPWTPLGEVPSPRPCLGPLLIFLRSALHAWTRPFSIFRVILTNHQQDVNAVCSGTM